MKSTFRKFVFVTVSVFVINVVSLARVQDLHAMQPADGEVNGMIPPASNLKASIKTSMDTVGAHVEATATGMLNAPGAFTASSQRFPAFGTPEFKQNVGGRWKIERVLRKNRIAQF
jgi:hypothetical protein